MTEQQKASIEEAADKKYHPVSDHKPHYIAGMQEVIEHPERYELYTKEQITKSISEGYDQAVWDITQFLTQKQVKNEQ